MQSPLCHVTQKQKETLHKNGFKGYFCSRPWIKLGGLHFDCISHFLSNPNHEDHLTLHMFQWPWPFLHVNINDPLESTGFQSKTWSAPAENRSSVFFFPGSFLNLSFCSHLFIFNIVSAVHHQHSTNIETNDYFNCFFDDGYLLTKIRVVYLMHLINPSQNLPFVAVY